ncbi:MAG: hypothetical protein ACFB4I_21645 [Cyanophyceae cyanobacterium]
MKRRNLLALFGVGWMANSFPVAIAMTFPDKSNRSFESQPQSVKWQQVSIAEELEQTGQFSEKNRLLVPS